MPVKQFAKQDLLDLMDGEDSKLKLVEDTITGNSRWSIHNYMVFQDIESEAYYGINYSSGATEYQDEAPFQYEDDMIDCTELVKKEVVTTQWVKL